MVASIIARICTHKVLIVIIISVMSEELQTKDVLELTALADLVSYLPETEVCRCFYKDGAPGKRWQVFLCRTDLAAVNLSKGTF